MPSPANRLAQFTESVIRGMTRLANRHDAINLAQGFPDFDPPEELLAALETATRGPHHQYAVTWGAPRFRQALAKKISRDTGLAVDPDQHLVVTCGSTEAMMVAMMTACNPGDKVIVFSPFYENYAADAILSGAEPIYVPLHAPDFGYDREELRKAFELKPKAIIVCNPSNPTGKVFTREELAEILALAEQADAWVITDEPYEHIVYAPHTHTYAAALPGAFRRVITCNSLSKTYSITGWRLGYVLASAEVIAQARKVHDFLTVGAAAPLQEAAVAGLELPESYYAELQALYTRKRDVFIDYLRRTGLPFTEPQGAYYVMLDISSLGFATDTEAAEWLVRKIGVAGVPGSSFFREPERRFIRFHFAKKEETLRAAGERLLRLADKDWLARAK
ncbi:aminotransferase class I/II-fold pyridoxal phosphate-dependent enzyme [Pelagicoccus sp. SDUM812003]|uniref:pyridoxal phosphate-dependent aminotransferase n=1 Tax=Pelagicoccus sp. SDUM812003 TaxID=3041267 RepID=UPI0028100351|nr:aminotransferase class I/II-fold pyridoxal phosphate-dependent enzyme [Pelagicoccus sp. SDUM812003]MDQ8201736.1 aminotransferase class I/II-fold pyridoxal phosphate-dependent enzyme [Pelagicoccus sp. SDUM812003]